MKTAKKAAAAIEHIAATILRIETLAPQNSDQLDFHEVGVRDIQAALLAAYKAGQAAK